METITAPKVKSFDDHSMLFAIISGCILILTYLLNVDSRFLYGVLLGGWLLIGTYVAHEVGRSTVKYLQPYVFSLLLTTVSVIVAWVSAYPISLLIIPVFLALVTSQSNKVFAIPVLSVIVFSVVYQEQELFSIFSSAGVLVVSVFVNNQYQVLREEVMRFSDEYTKHQSTSRKHEAFVDDFSNGRFAEVNAFGSDDTLGNKLFQMSLKLKRSYEEDRIRNWQISGLNELGVLIRQTDDRDASYSAILSFIVRYLNANQGALFAINSDSDEPVLQMKACYAYEKHKIKEAKISFGQGLIGQCVVDGEFTYLEKVPANYVHITSGLGLATPTSLVVVPLKHNEEILGVVELAFFQKLQKHELDFIKKASEVLGSAISFNQKALSTTNMLLESQRLAMALKEQQEETRQNLEELEATQENLSREALEKEKLQNEIKKSKEFLNLVIDSVPIPVFVKDRNHKMVLLNKAVCELNNMTKEQMLGKSDYDFFSKEEADVFWSFEEDIFINQSVAEKVEHAIRNGKETYTLDKKLYVRSEYGEDFLVGINIDVTDSKMMEKKMQLTS